MHEELCSSLQPTWSRSCLRSRACLQTAPCSSSHLDFLKLLGKVKTIQKYFMKKKYNWVVALTPVILLLKTLKQKEYHGFH